MVFALLILADSSVKNGLKVGFLSIVAVYVQLSAYGMGFIKAIFNGLLLKKGDTSGFVKNFYK